MMPRTTMKPLPHTIALYDGEGDAFADICHGTVVDEDGITYDLAQLLAWVPLKGWRAARFDVPSRDLDHRLRNADASFTGLREG